MKNTLKTLFLCFICTFFIVSYTFAQKGQVKYYGDKIEEKGAISAEKLFKKLGKKESMDAKISGKIIQSCTKKGCWMTMDMGNGKKMMVKFKDYAFFVPKDLNGEMAVIEGTAKKEVIDVATLRHYAEDAGKSKEEIEKINAPEEKYTFEAKGVIIKGK